MTEERGYGQAQVYIYTYNNDTFSRTQSAGDIGTPDIGPTYGFVGGSTEYGSVTVDGSSLVLFGTNDYDYLVSEDQLVIQDGFQQVDFKFDILSDWATLFDLNTRSPASRFPRLEAYGYYNVSAGAIRVYLSEVGGPSVHTDIALFDVDTWYTAKLQYIGIHAKVKVWKTSDPEPTTWLLEQDVSVLDAGSSYMYADNGESPTRPTMLYDNYFSEPLRFTDDFADARTYEFSIDDTGVIYTDMAAFTPESTDPGLFSQGDGDWEANFGAGAENGWLKFVTYVPLRYDINTYEYNSTDHDTALVILTGGPGTWTKINGNDDYPTHGYESQITGVLDPGTYYLLAGFYAGDYPLPKHINVSYTFSAGAPQVFGQAQALIHRNQGYSQAATRIKSAPTYYSSVIALDSPAFYARLDETLVDTVADPNIAYDDIGTYHLTRAYPNNGAENVSISPPIPSSRGLSIFPTIGLLEDGYLGGVSRFGQSNPKEGTTPTNWAYELWFKPTHLGSGIGQSLLTLVGGVQPENYGAYSILVDTSSTSPGRVYIGVGTNPTFYAHATGFNLIQDEMYHIVLTRGTGNLKLYINAVLVWNFNSAHNSVFGDSIVIGGTPYGTIYAGYTVAGLHDEHAMYVQELSLAQVTTHYFAGLSRHQASAQAQAFITNQPRGFGQAQTQVGAFKFAQTQALIIRFQGYGQAQAQILKINNPKHGQAAALIAIISSQPYYTDTFTRTVADGWGTSDSGDLYTRSLYGTTTSYVNGTQGVVSVPVGSTGLDFEVSHFTDGIVYLEFLHDFGTGGATPYFEFPSNGFNDANPYVGTYVYFTGTTFEVGAKTGPQFQSYSLSINSGITYALKFFKSGAEVYTKVWDISGGEPGWQVHLTLTNSGDINATGQILIEPWLTGSTVGTKYTYFDNIQASTYFVNTINAGYGQAQVFIRDTLAKGQAQAQIKALSRKFGQAQASILKLAGYGQATALINSLHKQVFGQALALIPPPKKQGQAQALIQPIDGLVAGIWTGGQTNVGTVGSWYSETGPAEPNYERGGSTPPGFPGDDNWGMMWAGTFVADVTGPWTFASSTDDGSKIQIEGPGIPGSAVTGNFSISGKVATMNNNYGGSQGEVYRDGTVVLTAGNLYTIQGAVGQGGSGWNFRFYYMRPGDTELSFLTDNNAPWISNSLIKVRRGQAQASIKTTYYGFGQALTQLNLAQQAAQAQAQIVSFATIKNAQVQALIQAKGLVVGILDITGNYDGNFFDELGPFQPNYGNYYVDQIAPPPFGGVNGGVALSGNFIAPTTGTWSFRIIVDDGAELWINNTLVIDAGFGTRFTSAGQFDGSISLVAGKMYNLHVKFYQGGGPYDFEAYYMRPSDSTYYFLTDHLAPWMRATISQGKGQATVDIKAVVNGYGQALAAIKHSGSGQAQARLLSFDYPQWGQAKADILATYRGVANARALITKLGGLGLALAQIKKTDNNNFGQALSYIGHFKSGQAQAFISKSVVFGQTKALIRIVGLRQYGQAQVVIYRREVWGQAQALIRREEKFAQANALISKSAIGVAQAQAFLNAKLVFGQAQTYVIGLVRGYGQAAGRITGVIKTVSQANAMIRIRYIASGQANVSIKMVRRGSGQALAQIGAFKFAQAQARITTSNVPRYGQAQGYILAGTLINPPTPTSGASSYLVQFGGNLVPGYAQSESHSSTESINDSVAAYMDKTLAEYLGLTNKTISLSMKLWEPTYQLCKARLKDASTILRLPKGFANLYIQRTDSHYVAMTQKIQVEKSVTEGYRTLTYNVDFEAKPWLISDALYEISASGSPTTIETVGRTLRDGTWTPTKVLVSGSDIVITGVNDNGDSTGSIHLFGPVDNFLIDTEEHTITSNGVNRNDAVINKDYSLYVGPGNTTFTMSGVSSIIIQYNNRWVLFNGSTTSAQVVAGPPIIDVVIPPIPFVLDGLVYGQAQGFILQPLRREYGQARVAIDSPIKNAHGQALSLIRSPITRIYAQAQTFIHSPIQQKTGQAAAFVRSPIKRAFGQAQTSIHSASPRKYGQAKVQIQVPVVPTTGLWFGVPKAITDAIPANAKRFTSGSLSSAMSGLNAGEWLVLDWTGTHVENVGVALKDGVTIVSAPGKRPWLDGSLRISAGNNIRILGLSETWSNADPAGHMFKHDGGSGEIAYGEFAYAACYTLMRPGQNIHDTRYHHIWVHHNYGVASHDGNQDHGFYCSAENANQNVTIDHALIENMPRGRNIKVGGPAPGGVIGGIAVSKCTLNLGHGPSNAQVSNGATGITFDRLVLIDSGDSTALTVGGGAGSNSVYTNCWADRTVGPNSSELRDGGGNLIKSAVALADYAANGAAGKGHLAQ